MLQKAFPRLVRRRNLCQPNGRFHRLDLAEKWAGVIERMVTPVLQQPRSFRGYAPMGGIWDRAPLIYVLAEGIDDRRGIVLLLLGGEPGALVEHKLRLLGQSLAFSGLGNRRDEFGLAPVLDNALCWLPLCIQLPVTCRIGIG